MKRLLFLLLPVFGWSQNLQDAKAAFEKDPESYQGKIIVDNVIAKEPTNAEAYFLEAKYYLGKNMYARVRENIQKAVELAPDSLEYRWVRANAVAENNYQTGIDDLNYMISKGAESGKIYLLLGKLNYEYARQLKYRPSLQPDYGYADKNPENEKILATNNSKAKEHLNQAESAFKRYENITHESAEDYLRDIERMRN